MHHREALPRWASPLRTVALLAGMILVAILLVTAIPRVRFVGGMLLDPSAAHTVPMIWFNDAATVATSSPDGARPPGVEGSVLFVRLTELNGATTLDRPFALSSDEQAVPSGEYELAVYWRGCNGNCGDLSREGDPFCHQRINLAPQSTLSIHVVPSELVPGSTCTVSSAPR